MFGPTARAVARLAIEGEKRRKLLVLLAAYQDGGCGTPSIAAITERCGFKDRRKTKVLLERLDADGLIENRNGSYLLLCLDDTPQAQAA